MIDLESKDNKNNFFEVLYQGKSKTFISSSFTNGEIVVLADWAGNIWAGEISSKKKLWEIKIKHPVLFEFVCYKGKVFVLNENTLFEIDVLTGLLTERASFKIVCSALQKDNKIYLNERSKKREDSSGKIVEVDLDSFRKKIIHDEQERGTYGALTRKEMIVIKDLVYFYSDKSIFNYNPIDSSSSRVYHHPDITHRVTGLASLGDNLVFVPGIQNPDAGKFHFPKNPDINSICMLKPDGSVAPLDKTAVQSTLDYSGSSISVGDCKYIATVGSYVFFQENESVVVKEIPGRRIGGSNCILYKKENELFIFEPSSYGNQVEELGFKLYKIFPERKEIELAEEYRTNKLGRNFKRAEFDIFGDDVIVRGDGRCYVLRMKSISRL